MFQSSERKDSLPAAAPQETFGPKLLRRVLLGAVTALIVARPLILGEDPGLLARPHSDASGLVLSLLWLVTALGWASWRLWSRQDSWRVSFVETGAIVVVGLMFASTSCSAAYKSPAMLISWEWLILLIIFLLVRQLARSLGDNRRLLAVMVASGISLATFAIYQYAEELPNLRRQLDQLTESPTLSEGERIELEVYRHRLDLGVYGAFSHPNSFSGFLALLLPPCLVWALVGFKRLGVGWMVGALWAGVVVFLIALAMTRSKGAILGSLLTLGILAVIQARRSLWSHKTWFLVATLVLAAGTFLITRSGAHTLHPTESALAKRFEYWSSTLRMLRDPQHRAFFWIGVGPGNFGRYYPRYMPETAFEEVQDPHNFVLEVWSSAGILAVTGLSLALGAFLWHVWPVVWRPVTLESEKEILETNDDSAGVRWEFYLGGLAGFILAFVIWASREQNPAVIYWYGILAVARSAIWFAAFALMGRIPCSSTACALGITAGILALLINLTVSGGISFPSVAQPLWMMIALGLNTSFKSDTWSQPRWICIFTPLLAGVVCLSFVLTIFTPVVRSHHHMQRALRSQTAMDELLEQAKSKNGETARDEQLLENTRAYNQSLLVDELEQAVSSDPLDAYARVQLADGYSKQWKIQSEINSGKVTGLEAMALSQAAEAAQLDPEGVQGYLALYQLDILFASKAESKRKKLLEIMAVEDLQKVVDRAPNRALYRYLLAEALDVTGNTSERDRQARKALYLENLTTEKIRKLFPAQRQQVQKWLQAPVSP